MVSSPSNNAAVNICESLAVASKIRVGETILETLDQNGVVTPFVTVRPLTVYWFITTACRSNCEHCIVSDMRAHSREPDRDELFFIADRLVESGISWTTLTGGEPLLRPELPELIDYLNNASVACYLVTSGVGLTDDLICKLTDAGLARLLVSIDGPEEVHDRFRGTGSHAIAMAALEKLSRRTLPYGLSVTMHADNFGAAEYLRDLAKSSGSSQFYIGEFIPNNKGKAQHMQPLTAEQRDRMYPDLLRLRAEDAFSPWAGQYDFDIVSPLLAAWVSDDLAGDSRKPGKKSISQKLHESMTVGCGAGTMLLAVMPDGEVYPCHGWQEPLGNLMHTPLLDIWNGDKLQQLRSGYLKRCGGCEHIAVCGGCPGRRNALGQDITTPDPECPIAACRAPRPATKV
jgi:radical SAM protein with 4Fe4S-binding SPASM domain